MIAEAVDAVREYSYRKEFGLSYREFMEEPWDVFLLNSHIMNHIAGSQRAEARSMERKANRG